MLVFVVVFGFDCFQIQSNIRFKSHTLDFGGLYVREYIDKASSAYV